MRAPYRSALAFAALATVVSLVPSAAHAEGGTIGVLVLKEHGVGSAAQAQPYIDKFVGIAARQNGWSGAKGTYQTTRTAAEKWISDNKPNYGIVSLAAFLAMKDAHKMDIVGQVDVARGGGQQYHLISKTAADLAGCKGKKLATDHGDDPKFIEKVVTSGSFKLADFTLVTTTRPIQTIKKVLGGEADCALVDDAQLGELSHVDGGAALKSVWSSAKLPPMVLVAFPSAPAAERKTFQGNLGKLCDGEGKATCGEVGIQSLKSASSADYAGVVAAYTK